MARHTGTSSPPAFQCILGRLYLASPAECDAAGGSLEDLLDTSDAGYFYGCVTTTTPPDVCELLGSKEELIDVVLVSDTGSTFTLEGKFTRLKEGDVQGLSTSSGIDGTKVNITGTNLLGGGNSFDSVTLAGVEVRELISFSNELIEVRAGGYSDGTKTGDVLLVANTGARVVFDSAWSYLAPGNIASITPSSGQKGTRVTIKGTALFGYGKSISSLSLVNTEVSKIVSADNNEIVVVVAPGGSECQFCHGTCQTCKGQSVLDSASHQDCLACTPSRRLQEDGQCTSICATAGEYRSNGTAIATVTVEVPSIFDQIFKDAERSIFANTVASVLSKALMDKRVEPAHADDADSGVTTEVFAEGVGLTVAVQIAFEGDLFEYMVDAVKAAVGDDSILNALQNADSSTYVHTTALSLGEDTSLSTGDLCQACDPTCAECKTGSSTQCTTCPEGRVYFNGACIEDSCPEGHYLDEQDTICKPTSCAKGDVIRDEDTGSLMGHVQIESSTGSDVFGYNDWSYVVEGQITKITPTKGQQGTLVTIEGTGLHGGASAIVYVAFSGVEVQEIVESTDAYIVVRSGAYDVARRGRREDEGEHPTLLQGSIEMIADSGAVIDTPTTEWSFVKPSVVDDITPNFGHYGTAVTLTGERLFGLGTKIVSVTLGGVEATLGIQTSSSIELVAGTGANTAGYNGDVVVTSDTGAEAVLKDAWRYVAQGVIEKVDPAQGQESTRIVISGTGLYGGGTRTDHVTVCGIEATIVTDLPELIVVDLGLGSDIVGDVVVTSDTGAELRSVNGFHYIVAGAIESVTPANGRKGTEVEIVGSNLFGGGDYIETVELHGIFAELVTTDNDRISVIANEGIAGTGSVKITSNRGAVVQLVGGWLQESTGSVGQYGIVPALGQYGTEVKITGGSLRGGGEHVVSVTLAGTEVEGIVSESDTEIDVIVAHSDTAGTGDVVILADSGAVLRIEDAWRYLETSIIYRITPTSGQKGTLTTIDGDRLHGGGNYVATVTLAGTEAEILGSGDRLINLRVNYAGSGSAGDVVVVSDSGAITTLVNGWTQHVDAEITTLTPSKGELGTIVVISGERLLGGGDHISKVVLAGAEATVLESSDTAVTVRSEINVPQVGDVQMTADTGAYTELVAGWEYNAVNDAPVVHVTATVSTFEDAGDVAVSISISDTDAEEINGDMSVELSVNVGVLSVGFPSSGTCNDLQVDNAEWHDAAGPEFTCAWYEANDKCATHGDDVRNSFGGLTGAQACCACDGGNEPLYYSTLKVTGTLQELNNALANAVFVSPANMYGVAQISITANDHGNSGSGGAKSGSSVIDITIDAVNDAPVLQEDASPEIPQILEDALESSDATAGEGEAVEAVNDGATVASFADDIISDVDPDPLGIAVTAADSSNGDWEFMLHGDSEWTQIPSNTGFAVAVLLPGDAALRFAPDLHYNGDSTFTFGAWDRSDGNTPGIVELATISGSTAYSGNRLNAKIHVASINDIPTLDLDLEKAYSVDAHVDFTEASTGALLINKEQLEIIDFDHSTLSYVKLNLLNPLDGDFESLEVDTVIAGDLDIEFAVTLNEGTYMLTLSSDNGRQSIDDYKTVLATAKYTNSKDEPSTDQRTVEVTLFDGEDFSQTAKVYIEMIPINDHTSVLTIPKNDRTFVEGGDPLLLIPDSALTLADADHNEFFMIHNAVIEITTSTADAGDQSISVLLGTTGITTDFEGQTLTLHGPATVAAFQQVMRTAQYINGADEPEPGARAISFKVFDGKFTSNTETVKVTVEVVNDQIPVIDLNGPDEDGIGFSVTFVEEGPAVACGSANLVVTDADSDDNSGAFNMVSGRVEIETVYDGDLETIEGTGSATVTLTSCGDHCLELTGPAPAEDFAEVFRTIKYSNLAEYPGGPLSRAIVYTVFDGKFTSAGVATALTVQMINDEPVVDLALGDADAVDFVSTFVEGDGAVSITGTVKITDEDHMELTGATLRLVNAPDHKDEVLEAETGGTSISTSYKSVVNEDRGPGEGRVSAGVSFKLSHVILQRFDDEQQGIMGKVIADLTDAHLTDASVGAVEASVEFNEVAASLGSAGIDIEMTVSVTEEYVEDLSEALRAEFEAGNVLTSLKEASNAYFYVEEVEFLEVDGARKFDIIEFYGILTLTGTDSLENYAKVLSMVTYNNTKAHPGFPSPIAREIVVTVTDGVEDSAPVVATVTFKRVNDRAIVDLNGPSAGRDCETLFVEEGSPTPVAENAVLTDIDNTSLTYTSIQLVTNPDGSGERIEVDDADVAEGITAAYDGDTATLTLSGDQTVAAYQATLRAVKYSNSQDEPTPTDRRLKIIVGDGLLFSTPRKSTVTVQMINDEPRLDLDSSSEGAGYTASYTEDSAGVAVVSDNVHIEDDDDVSMVAARVSITNAQDAGYERLYLSNDASVQQVGGNMTETLMLDAEASIADWLEILKSVMYVNLDDDPEIETGRVIEIFVIDAASDADPNQQSNVVQSTITVIPVNDAPQMDFSQTTEQRSVLFTETEGPVALFGNFDTESYLFDADDVSLTEATFQIDNVLDRNPQGIFEILAVNFTAAGVDGDAFVSVYSPEGVLTIVGEGSIADYKTILSTLSYENIAPSPSHDSRSVSGVVGDGRLLSYRTRCTVELSLLNDPPLLDLNGERQDGFNFEQIFVQKGPAVSLVSPQFILDDHEDDLIKSLNLEIIPFVNPNHEELLVTYDAGEAGSISGARTVVEEPIDQFCASNGIPVSSDCVPSTTMLTQTGEVSEVNVYLNIAHERLGEVRARLVHDDVTVMLISSLENEEGVAGQCRGKNFDNIVLSDNAEAEIQNQCADGITGVFKPAGSLADFNGLDASGEWLLIVEDTFRQFSAGELGGWSLTVHTSASDTQPQATFAANTEVSVAAGETKTSSMNVDSSHAARTLAFTVHFSAESTEGVSISAVHPDGTQIALFSGKDGCGNDNLRMFTFADSGVSRNDEGCYRPSSATVLKPEEPLSAMMDEAVTGTWSLIVSSSESDVVLLGWLVHSVLKPNMDWSFDATKGVLNIVGFETEETYYEILDTVRYQNTRDVPFPIDRRIAFTIADVYDETLPPSNTTVYMHNAAIIDLAVNDNGDNVNGTETTYTENSPPVYIIDLNNAEITSDGLFPIESASAEILNVQDIGDEHLSWTDSAKIVGMQSGDGILFVGLATPAEYLQVISSITYSNAQENPHAHTHSGLPAEFPTARRIELKVTDTSGRTSIPAYSTVTIVPVNDDPILDLDGEGASASFATLFTENSPAPSIANKASLTDIDNVHFEYVSIAILNPVDYPEEFVFSSASGKIFDITTESSAERVSVKVAPTADEPLTAADIENFLNLATYNNNAAEPSPDARNIEIVVSDGTATSNVENTVVAMQLVNDNNPILHYEATQPVFTETPDVQGRQTALFTVNPINLLITDEDRHDTFFLHKAVITLAPTPDGTSESLAVAAPTSLSTSYNAAAREFTIEGSGTVEEYNAVILSVEYANTKEEPTPGDRTATVTVFDKDFVSNTIIITIQVDLVNDRVPVLDLDATDPSGLDIKIDFTEEGDSVHVTSQDLLLTDADSGIEYEYPTLISKATVTLVDRRDGEAEYLTVTGSDKISVTISTAVNDERSQGGGRYRKDVNQLAAADEARSRAARADLCSDIDISGRNGVNNEINGVYAEMVEPYDGKPAFAGENNGLFLFYDSNILGGAWLVGSELGEVESISAYLSEDTSTPVDHVESFRIWDGFAWVFDEAIMASCVTPTTTQTTSPTTSTTPTTTTATTTETTTTQTTTQTTTPLPIDHSTTIVIVLEGLASKSDYEEVLKTIMYHNTADEPEYPRTRHVEFVVYDATFASIPAVSQITIHSINDLPRLNLDVIANDASKSSTIAYTEGDGAVSIVPNTDIEEDDDTHLEEAVIVLTNHPDEAEEYLTVDLSGTAITQSGTKHSITLVGPDTVENFIKVLSTVAYQNDKAYPGNPDTALRTVTVTVNDGDGDSNVRSAYISFAGVNNRPMIDLNTDSDDDLFTSTDFSENDAFAVLIFTPLSVVDVDGEDLTSATITITNCLDDSEEAISFAEASAIDQQISANYDVDSCTLSLTGAAAVSAYVHALEALVYTNTKEEPYPTTRAVSITVTDGDGIGHDESEQLSYGGLKSVTAFVDVRITLQNDHPVATATSGRVEFVEDSTGDDPSVAIVPDDLTITDNDDDQLQMAVCTVTDAVDEGYETLFASSMADAQITQRETIDGSSITLKLTGIASIGSYRETLLSIKYENTADAPTEQLRYVSCFVRDLDGADSDPFTNTIFAHAHNDAPELLVQSVDLTSINEDILKPDNVGNDMLAMFDGAIADPDSNPKRGLVITSADSDSGQWEFSQVVIVKGPPYQMCDSPCHASCRECSGTAANKCTACFSSQQLSLDGQCVSHCADGLHRGPGTVTEEIAITINDILIEVFEDEQQALFAAVLEGQLKKVLEAQSLVSDNTIAVINVRVGEGPVGSVYSRPGVRTTLNVTVDQDNYEEVTDILAQAVNDPEFQLSTCL